jgi:hypothetical protein
MMGMPAFKGNVEKIAQALNDMVPLKYKVTLKDNAGFFIRGQVVTFLELDEYLDWKNYKLVSVNMAPDIALASERTNLELDWTLNS